MSRFWIVPGVDDHAMHTIAKFLRPEDAHEIACWGLSRDELPGLIQHCRSQMCWTVYRGDEPVFVFGLVKQTDTVRSAWGLGTPKVRAVVPRLTQWIRSSLVPTLLVQTQINRVEIRIPMTARGSILWLLASGFQVAGRLREYGAARQDFLLLDITRDSAKHGLSPHVHHSNADGTGTAGTAHEVVG